MNKVKLLDRDNMTVHMTEVQIAESIRKMGNKKGKYKLITEIEAEAMPILNDIEATPALLALGMPVVQFRASTMPHYSWLQIMRKKWRWLVKQKASEEAFNATNTHNLIWKPTPFVLEMPWLRLKGKKAVTINVE